MKLSYGALSAVAWLDVSAQRGAFFVFAADLDRRSCGPYEGAGMRSGPFRSVEDAAQFAALSFESKAGAPQGQADASQPSPPGAGPGVPAAADSCTESVHLGGGSVTPLLSTKLWYSGAGEADAV